MLTWPQGTGIIAQIKLRLVLDDSRSRGGDCEHACDSKIERPCALSDEGDGRPKPIHPVLATDHFN